VKNSCESFFGQLTKHTEGKRKHLASSLEVVVLFVAGMRSDPDVCTKMLTAGGAGQSSATQDKGRARIQANEKRHVVLTKTPEHKAQRMHSQIGNCCMLAKMQTRRPVTNQKKWHRQTMQEMQQLVRPKSKRSAGTTE
jgi:hypothetical protein